MSVRSRGPVGSATRTAKVLLRFGATPSAMARRLERYRAITAEYGISPTWPATACVLARHPDLLRQYADEGVELALHGLVHGDHAALDREQQRTSIARAMAIFERCGVAATGFRGPYLRYNESTLDVLREIGLGYHSSQAVAFPLRDGEPRPGRAATRYGLALAFYGALDARRVSVTPKLRGGLVDIPVAVPDDEILAERLDLDQSARAAEWVHILEHTHERGELFTVQLHPERIPELGEALRVTLADARRRRPALFIARLDQIAAWWRRRSSFRVIVTRSGEHRYRVHVAADPDATLVVRGIAAVGTPWYGPDAVYEARDFEVVSPRIPIVGVSARSPRWVTRLLAEEGFPFELSDARGAYGSHIDLVGDASEADVLSAIDAAPGPLVRIWRWPNASRSALAVTGDIDAITLFDFAIRSWETRAPARAAGKTS